MRHTSAVLNSAASFFDDFMTCRDTVDSVSWASPSISCRRFLFSEYYGSRWIDCVVVLNLPSASLAVILSYSRAYLGYESRYSHTIVRISLAEVLEQLFFLQCHDKVDRR